MGRSQSLACPRRARTNRLLTVVRSESPRVVNTA